MVERINFIAREKGQKTTEENKENNQRVAQFFVALHSESQAKHHERHSRMEPHVRDVWSGRQLDFLLEVCTKSNGIVAPFQGTQALDEIATKGWSYDGDVVHSGRFEKLEPQEAAERQAKRQKVVKNRKTDPRSHETPQHCKADMGNAKQCYDSLASGS